LIARFSELRPARQTAAIRITGDREVRPIGRNDRSELAVLCRPRDRLLVEITAVHAEVKGRYGSPRIHAELNARGHGCCVCDGILPIDNKVSVLQSSAARSASAVTTALHAPGHRVVNLDTSTHAELARVVVVPSGQGYLVSSNLPALGHDLNLQNHNAIQGTFRFVA